MWKNFFKWIADHTGISWIARKISSGWKNWWSGDKKNQASNTSQSKDQTQERTQSRYNTLVQDHSNKPISLPCEPNDNNRQTAGSSQANSAMSGEYQESMVNECEGELRLFERNGITSLRIVLSTKNYYNEDKILYIRHGQNQFRISSLSSDEGKIFAASILEKSEDVGYMPGNIKYVQSDIKEIAEMLDLTKSKRVIKVVVSKEPFKNPVLEQCDDTPSSKATSTVTTPVVDSNKPVTAGLL